MLIPPDVWLSVAEFLPKQMISSLKDFNATFKYLARKVQYQVVTLSTYVAAQQLFEAVRNPEIAELVHEVCIRPWLVVAPIPIKGSERWPTRLQARFHRLYDHNYPQRSAEEWRRKILAQQIQTVLDGIAHLKQLFNYKLEMDYINKAHSEELLTGFLCPVLSLPNVRHSLMKLTIKIPPDKLRKLAPINLPNLEELEFQLITGDVPTKLINEMLDGFLIFVNNLKPSLRSLSITSPSESNFLDLSWFFHSLGTFPHLTAFAICIPFDGAHLSDPSTLRTFLSRHAETLEKVSFGTSPAGCHLLPLHPSSRFWIRRVIMNVGPLPNLKCLTYAMRPLRADLAPVYQYLYHIAPQLESLVLTDRAFTCAEVGNILKGFYDAPDGGKLKHLSIRAQALTPSLLDCLASKVPYLKSLELQFPYVYHEEPEDGVYPDREEEFDLFREVMANRRYPSWNLRKISIKDSPYKGVHWIEDLEKIFLNSIPSLCDVCEIRGA